MEEFPAFFVLIKTNFGKTIAYFVDSKYESTRDMEFEIDGEADIGKQTNNEMIFYFIDDKLVKCKYKH